MSVLPLLRRRRRSARRRPALIAACAPALLLMLAGAPAGTAAAADDERTRDAAPSPAGPSSPTAPTPTPATTTPVTTTPATAIPVTTALTPPAPVTAPPAFFDTTGSAPPAPVTHGPAPVASFTNGPTPHTPLTNGRAPPAPAPAARLDVHDVLPQALPPPRRTAAVRAAAQPAPDFAFGPPGVTVAVYGLWRQARGASDFYQFLNENFFVRRAAEDDHTDPSVGTFDFNAPGIGADIGFFLSPRIDVRGGFDFTLARVGSEVRQFLGSDGLPIEQDTTIRQTSLWMGTAFALLPRGRAIGQYVWVPRTITPYVGAGGGVVRYDLEQSGEFVDANDFSIREDLLRSGGWGLSGHLFGGFDIRVSTSMFVNVEARQVYAKAELGETYVGFEPLDLTGFQLAAGMRFVF